MECKFEKGDYIIARKSGDMAVFKNVDKKSYMHFTYSYGAMFDELRDVSKYTLQLTYQNFYDKCTEEEKELMDNHIKRLTKETTS